MKHTLKKSLAIILAAATLLCCAPLSGIADLDLPEFSTLFAPKIEATSDDIIKYHITDMGTVAIWGHDETATGSLVIPSTIEGYPVSSVLTGAFCNSQFSSIVISEGVTEIGYNAFSGCDNLTSVTIPDSVTHIGSLAFAGNEKLERISIGNNLESIGYNAFLNTAYANNEKNYDLNGCLYIGKYLIDINEDSTGVFKIKEGTLGIGDRAIQEQQNITDISFPNSLKFIGSSSFYNCKSIKTIIIPNNVTIIGSAAFNSCTSLEKVYLPENLSEIAHSVFQGCVSLKDIIIPERTSIIGESAFGGCISLNSISIPDSVNKIGEHAFQGCLNLKYIDIGQNVTDIGEGVFDDTGYSLNEANWTDNTLYIDNYFVDSNNISGSFQVKDGTIAIAGKVFNSDVNVDSAVTSLVIPDSVRAISDEAFFFCKNLTEINFGNNSQLFRIGADSFHGCEKLTQIALPEKLSFIGEMVFRECSNLKSIVIPSNIETIERWAFYGCENLSNIRFNSCTSLKTIEESVFSGCSSLVSIFIPQSVEIIGNSSFSYCTNLELITFEKGSKLKTIAGSAFSNCSKLTSIDIPETIKEIYGNAFYNCSALSIINFGENSQLEYLGSSAFEQCDSLSEITIPHNTSELGERLFAECDLISAINVDSRNRWYKSIDGVLFDYDQTTLILFPYGKESSNYNIPETVKIIDDYAFYSCDKINSVTMGNKVEVIGLSAFYKCYNLETIVLPDSLQKIAESAFGDCQKLNKVNLGKNVAHIGEQVFFGCDSLREINVDAQNKYYTSINGVLLNKEKTELIKCPISTPITEFKIPSSVVTICNSAFKNVKNMKLIEFESKSMLRYIESESFMGSGIKSFVVPKNVETLEYASFKNCKDLETFLFEEGCKITSIGSSAFMDADSLVSIVFPESVTIIDSQALEFCDSLSYVYIPSSVIMINTSFEECNSLKEIDIHPKNKNYSSSFGAMVSYGNKDIYFIKYPPLRKGKSFAVENGVTHILSKAFQNSSNLVSIALPESIKTIYSNAFDNCNNLETVYYGGSPSQWSKINIYENNSAITNAEIVFAKEDDPTAIPGTVVLKDSKTDVEFEYPHNFYDGSVDFQIEPTFDETAFDIISAELDVNKNIIYDIKMTIDGEETQPNGTVKVKIPVPEEYDLNLTFVYHVSASGHVKKMNAVIEKIHEKYYLVFETDHFSYYALVELDDSCEHSYTSSVTTPATCTENGVLSYTCAKCDAVYTESIPALGHNAGYWETVTNSTCTAFGEKVKKCVNCATVLETAEIPATGHTQGSWVISIAPSCTDAGEKIAHCTVCGQICANDIIPATGHVKSSWITTKAATCTAEGERVRKCVYCGEVMETEKTPITAHTPGNWSVSVNPTCTEKGEKVRRCTDCGILLEAVEMPMLSHTPGSWITVLEPTTTTEGKMVRKCTACGVMLEEKTIPVIEDDITVEIRTPSRTTINYGDSIILHAEVDGVMPVGYTLNWTASNGNFSVEPNGDTCKITPVTSGDTTITLILADENGTPVDSAKQTMTSKAGFFDKIIAFFKKIFGRTKTYPDIFGI